MFGPLHFGPLCMSALIIWWVYSRKPLVGVMIATGLVCSITRSTWVGTAVAVPLLAVGLGQMKRFVKYAVLALALFAASVPFLGLGDYLSANKSGEDHSAELHQESILEGLTFVASHPVGLGSANFGRQAQKNNSDAFYFENAYLTLAGEYGIPTVLCLVGFLVTAFRASWQQGTRLGYGSAGIIAGFSVVLIFASLHDVFPLACWLWFPVGLAVASSVKPGHTLPAGIWGRRQSEGPLSGFPQLDVAEKAE
jgi:O-Antigen ligase